MSWESVASKEFLRNGVSHQLSASRLLPSPDCSKPSLVDDRASISCSRYIEALDSPNGSELRYDHYIGTSNSLLGACAISMNHGYVERNNWGCFSSCRSRFQQVLAKRKINQGLKLYNKHKQHAAVRKWKSALKTIKTREDKFALLGYLYQGYMDWGKYREALEFGHAQLGISEELDSPNMRAESYLNLAKAHEKLGAFERALAYARHSLYNECDTCLTAGYVHLTVGSVYLELAGFSKALESFQRAHKIAHGIHDPALELQVYVGLSELFNRLQDSDKSTKYASKAYDLSRSLQLGDLNSRHHRAALIQMASSLRKQGEYGDAHDYCSEATRLALVSGDHATYVRSVRIMGDIYRKKCDINKAFSQYETAMGTAAAMGDRIAQMESMDGAARCLEALRLQGKICNCRPLEFNTRLLEVASSVGSKLLVRVVRLRLSSIYNALGDVEQQLHHERIALCIEQDLGLTCGACTSPLGLEPDCLEPLACGHIVHARCAQDIFRRKDKKKKSICPDCHRSINSRIFLNSEDSRVHQSSLSLASLSLRASTSTLNSNYHITSSV
ncbi:43 kDa receptor-associated protein of the synapse homolog [Chrysoperla carnea]|uniref:43 kDa receptor-associated protein of the synapse homolog n=1 Tax=Chrysoperla carnea TaxID=189513 RepID=UPI001D097334|nr:43 kDa receptor-associated protein of the synapse homolog [Chrysoperla carnea]